MGCIEINKATCINCGKCVEECPGNVLSMANTVEICDVASCISCGHCAAICPENAIKCDDNNSKHPFTIAEIDATLPLDKLLFHKKRSVRAFRSETIKPEAIKEMVHYAEKAPSSHNFRNRKYLVITNPEDISKISLAIVKKYKGYLRALNPITLGIISFFNRNAYHELLKLTLGFKKMIGQFKEGNNKIFRKSSCIICIAAPTKSTHSAYDCIAAEQYMLLFGKTIGIDSYISGYAQYAHKVIEKFYGLRNDYSIFAVSAFGLGKHSYSKEVIYAEPEVIWR